MGGVAEAVHPLGFARSLFGSRRSTAPAERPRFEDHAPIFDNLNVEIEPRHGAYWCRMRPRERPSFTPGLLADLADMQRGLVRMANAGATPIRYYVLASELPGIFNLGGDLTVLAQRVRQRDRDSLVRYARACIDVLYNNAVGFDLPIVTVALVQGDALGGGFEAALSCDIIVAEKGTRFGLPEVLFNLFPGMGAYSFLSRRLDSTRAEQLMLSGRLYSADELKDMGIVDVVCEDGQGVDAVDAFVKDHEKAYKGRQAILQARHIVNPITREELMKVTDLWVDTAVTLEPSDLRRMRHLATAQNRRWAKMKLAA